ncbi:MULTISPECIES: hypothetical protein [Rhodococcus]|uniref:lipopolysaccharide biosynthesis protein n=1 Tax=Rhodococcus TaxID=1827 RepID=UPI0029549DB1|nr:MULTISPECIES: hypothetical protein [Rhodococcus]MDV8028532.1 hypothetical protein [Rhodococcus sp. IEGM 27]
MKSTISRGVVMVITVACSFTTTWLIIHNASATVYSYYALLVTIPALLVFSDLGVGAAVVNAVADEEVSGSRERTQRVLLTAIRITTAVGIAIIFVDTIVYVGGWWPAVLGVPDTETGIGLAAFMAVLIYSIGLPFSIGQRVLLGARLNHLAVLTLGIQAPVTFLGVVLVFQLGLNPMPFLPVSFFLAGLISLAISAWLAARKISPSVGWAVTRVLDVHGCRGDKVMNAGIPMLVQLVAAAVAIQSGRYVVSHLGTVPELAQYSLSAQIFTSVGVLVATAGMALWPIFANDRARGTGVSPQIVSLVFGGVAAALCTIISIFADYIFDALSGGSITVSSGMLLAFSCMVCLQAAVYPLGMYLTDVKGLRLQVLPLIVMAISAVSLSFFTFPFLGPSGPIIATAASIGVFQLVPYSAIVSIRRKSIAGLDAKVNV